MSARGEILDALFAMLGGLGGTVLRNASLPAAIPDDGLIIMRDGEPGEPSQFFGGAHLIEHYNHSVEVLIFSASATPEAEIYGIADEIAAAARANRTLGGLVDAVSVRACTVEPVAVGDGAPFVAGTLPIVLRYSLEVAA